MNKKILQISFRLPENLDLTIPKGEEVLETWVNNANEFPGLEWKIWTQNEETNKLGGIYLFNDKQSLKNYVNGEDMASVNDMEDVEVQELTVEEEFTKKTQGPIE